MSRQIIRNYHGYDKTGLTANDLVKGELAIVTKEPMIAFKNDEGTLSYLLSKDTLEAIVETKKTEIGSSKANKLEDLTANVFIVFKEGGDIALAKDGDSYITEQNLVKVENGKSLVTTEENAKLESIASGATKVTASEDNGYVLINDEKVLVFAEREGTVHDENYKHITVTSESVSDGTNTFTKTHNADEVNVTLDGNVSKLDAAFETVASKVGGNTLKISTVQNDVLVFSEATRQLSTQVNLLLDGQDIVLTGLGNKVLGTVSGADFVKDGMVQSAAWSETKPNTLVITWNTDAGIATKELDLSKYVDVYVVSGDSTTYMSITEDNKLKLEITNDVLNVDKLLSNTTFNSAIAGKLYNDTIAFCGELINNENQISADKIVSQLKVVTTEASGIMTTEMKTKLDGIEEGADVNRLDKLAFDTVTTAASEQSGAKTSEIDSSKGIIMDFSGLTVDCGTW